MRQRWKLSLRSRLVLWILPVTLLVGLMASVATYFEALDELDDLLKDQLKVVSRYVTVDEAGRLALRTDTKLKAKHLSGEQAEGVLLQVWRNGVLEFSSGDAPLPAPVASGWQEMAVNGQAWHAFVNQQGTTQIRVAQAVVARREALAGIVMQLLWPVLAISPVLALFLWFGMGHGLKPLRRISDGLAQRNASNMNAIDTDIPGEVKPLVEAINSLLVRLDQAFTKQKHFIADAAHELRTPIAGLSLQAELLERAEDNGEQQAIMAQIQAGAKRLTRLAQQLLMLAQLDPDTQEEKQEAVDLVRLARSVIGERAVLAGECRVDLGVEVEDPSVVIQGYPDSLKMLLNNLVDNAIRYAGEGARVDVQVSMSAMGGVLKVCDNGPGIPASERERIWERFYRGVGNQNAGSGLGLSIVRRVAEQHRATVSIEDGLEGRGISFVIQFFYRDQG